MELWRLAGLGGRGGLGHWSTLCSMLASLLSSSANSLPLQLTTLARPDLPPKLSSRSGAGGGCWAWPELELREWEVTELWDDMVLVVLVVWLSCSTVLLLMKLAICLWAFSEM